MNNAEIKLISRDKIDSAKWAECIENALNGRFYANEWHLDRSSENWDALVFGDYEYVMPLPVKKKFGIKYVYHPLFSQQLGIFPSPSGKVTEKFYRALYSSYKYVDTQLNSGNQQGNLESNMAFLMRRNFLLALNSGYSAIEKKYSKNTKRNLSKVKKNKLNLIAGIRLEEYLAFKTENLQGEVGKNDIKRLKSIIAFGQYKGFGEIYGVYSSENQLCAAAYFCRWKDRVILMNAASNPLGKELGGMYFLVDSFIQSNAGKNLILDFEGSMITGVARFYSGFGAEAETYFQLKFNRLPLLLMRFKK